MKNNVDNTLEKLINYLSILRKKKLSKNEIKLYNLHILDSIGCCIAAQKINEIKKINNLYKIENNKKTKSIYQIIGSNIKSTIETATFCNTAGIRYLDFNDTGIGAHPSDMLGALFPAAQSLKMNIFHFLKPIQISYEIMSNIRLAGLYGNLLREKHIDQLPILIASVMGIGEIFKFNVEKIRSSLSIAICSGIPLRATRTGKISNWKSLASAHYCSTAMRAAMLSKVNITGPSKVFEGSGGFYEMFGLKSLNLDKIGKKITHNSAIESTSIKLFPANFNSQGPLSLISNIKNDLDINEIKKISVFLHWGGWHSQGGGAKDKREKFNPKNKETALNNMAFVVGAGILYGKFDLSIVKKDFYKDPLIKKIVKKIKILHDVKLTKKHAGPLPSWPSRIEVKLKNNIKIIRQINFPNGHPYNPAKPNEIIDKFKKNINGKISKKNEKLLIKIFTKINLKPNSIKVNDIVKLCSPITKVKYQ